MSDSEFPNPIPPSHDGASNPDALSDDAVQPDPLLASDSFIDLDENQSKEEEPECENQEVKQDVEFEADVVIDAQPISMLAPGDNWAESTPKAKRMRTMEEMEKRPDWLPDGWQMELRVRENGATAGSIDRYYVAPEGKRKLRSKNEVFRFLESGGKSKRKGKSDADTEPPSGSSGSSKKAKSDAKGKKSETAEA